MKIKAAYAIEARAAVGSVGEPVIFNGVAFASGGREEPGYGGAGRLQESFTAHVDTVVEGAGR